MINETLNEDDNFVRVEGGTFRMGNNDGDRDERPVHTVMVKSFDNVLK